MELSWAKVSLIDLKQSSCNQKFKQEEDDHQCDIWMISERLMSRENILSERLSKQDWDQPQYEKEDLLTMLVQYLSAFSLEEDKQGETNLVQSIPETLQTTLRSCSICCTTRDCSAVEEDVESKCNFCY